MDWNNQVSCICGQAFQPTLHWNRLEPPPWQWEGHLFFPMLSNCKKNQNDTFLRLIAERGSEKNVHGIRCRNARRVWNLECALIKFEPAFFFLLFSPHQNRAHKSLYVNVFFPWIRIRLSEMWCFFENESDSSSSMRHHLPPNKRLRRRIVRNSPSSVENLLLLGLARLGLLTYSL